MDDEDFKRKDVLIKIKRAKIKIQKDFPFFSDLLFFIRIREVNVKAIVPTMAVDGKGNLYYNPEWVDKLSTEEIKGVLAHEVLHMALLHVIRGMKKTNQGVWNVAIDSQANFICLKNGFKLPKDGCAQPDVYNNCVHIVSDNCVHIVSDKGRAYTVHDVEKKPSEQIYLELLENLPKDMVKSLSQRGTISISVINGNAKPDGSPSNSGSFDGHIYDASSSEEAQREENEWKQRLINAVERSKHIGKSPAGMDRIIKEMLEPEIPWRNKLYKFIVDGIPFDYTYRRRHKRSAALGFFAPDYDKEALEVAVFIDTSGSIADDDIKEFKAECVGIAKAFESVDMSLGYCDAKVQGEVIKVENGNIQKIIESTPKGGGGTDMRECFYWLDKNLPSAKVVVILTDGYTPFATIDEVRGRNVLWVICKKGMKKSDSDKEQNETPGEFVFLDGE